MPYSDWITQTDGYYRPNFGVGYSAAFGSLAFPPSGPTLDRGALQSGSGVVPLPAGTSVGDGWSAARKFLTDGGPYNTAPFGLPYPYFAGTRVPVGYTLGVGARGTGTSSSSSDATSFSAAVTQQFRWATPLAPTMPTTPKSIPALIGKIEGTDFAKIPSTNTYVEYDGTPTFVDWKYQVLVDFMLTASYYNSQGLTFTPALAATLQVDLAVVDLAEYATWVTTNNTLPTTELGTHLASLSGQASQGGDPPRAIQAFTIAGHAAGLGVMCRMPNLSSAITEAGQYYGSISVSGALYEAIDSPGTKAGNNLNLGYGFWAHYTLPRYRYWIPPKDVALITNLAGQTGDTRAFYEETR